MSADIQAPGLSLNVRYSRGDKKNKGQQEDLHVESDEDQETLKLGHADLRSHKVTHRRHVATASILGVLYLLILAGLFMRYIFVTFDQKTLVMEREQLMITLNQTQARIINLTQENDELRNRYDSLSNENSGLKSETDVNKQLRTDIIALTAERDELQTRSDRLSNENSRLKTENMNMKTENTALANKRDELQARYDSLMTCRR